MKKVIIILIMFLGIGVGYGEELERKESMSLYRENYFVAGDRDDQVKFQFSAKYQMVIPDKDNLPFDSTWNDIISGLKVFGSWTYLGYTQTSWWTVYSGRDTFSSNYQPEGFLMIESKTNVLGWDFGPVKYLKVSPVYHESTGTEGADHRSVMEFYGEFDVSYVDDNKSNELGIDLKGFGYYYREPRNKDINDYRDNYEAMLYYIHTFDPRWWWPVKEQGFHFISTGNPFGKGYYMLESTTKFFGTVFMPKIFIQYSHGYGVNIVYYNIKQSELRFGVLFDSFSL